MDIKFELEEIIEKIVGIYKEVCGKKLEQVYLYGSYAKGTYHLESDIDFAAIVHGERREVQNYLESIWEKANEVSLEYDIIVSPVVIPYEEFIDLKQTLPYYRNIVEEGVAVA